MSTDAPRSARTKNTKYIQKIPKYIPKCYIVFSLEERKEETIE